MVLAAGDIHRKAWHAHYLFREAVRVGADAIVACGDVAYTNNDAFVRYVQTLSEQTGVPFYWLDGNHDDHDYLRSVGATRSTSMTAVWPHAPNLLHIPRGHAWVWGERRCMAVGGAVSVDRHTRSDGVSWWHGESISEADVRQACDNGPVDVLFTHDAPEGVRTLYFGNADTGVWRESRRSREAVAAIVEAVRPKLVVHGHYHVGYEEIANIGSHRCRVIGLGCHGQGKRSWTPIQL